MDILVTKDIIKDRKDICNGCSWKSLNICKACNCFLPAKVTLKSSECPFKKW